MMACIMVNQIQLFRILVASVFLMLCMNAIVISSGSEVVPIRSNMTMLNRCIETERRALLMIKRGLVDIHGLLSSWGSPQEEDCCRWSGVGCDTSTSHVIRLNLSYVSYDDADYGVTYPTLRVSYLSCSLLELKNLKFLDLSWIDFGELPIPKLIGRLSNLVYLDLSIANLGGAVPDEFGNLSRLNHLDLSSNLFDSSSFPEFIASLSLTNLRYLGLSDNQLTGAIPHGLGNLSKLHHLDLSYNYGLGGGNFGCLFHLSSLTHLDLSGISAVNDWKGLIQRLPSLSVLRLNECNLNSTPSSFLTNSSSSISTLDLGLNELDVSVFDWLSNVSGSLVDLDLSYNQLEGNIPESFAYMTKLQSLKLFHNQLDGVFPTKYFRNLSSLQFIDFTLNNMRGNLEDILYVLPADNLQVLLISQNNLTGSLPDITRFSSLIEFDVSDNQLNGYVPDIFQHKSLLQSLVLSSNYLRGSLPSFTGFSHLKYLYLAGNNFSGRLPDFMGSQSLRYLSLDYNEFSGSLPDFVGLQSLEYLSLGHNKLSGSLPDFTGLQSLIELYLDHNKFSGSIPDFTRCSSLVVLKLEENEITEWKTRSIGQLTNLTRLDLSKNSIHSTITESHLSGLSNLEYMNASFNSLIFNVSSGWLPPFQLTHLSLASCKLGPKFPNWIGNQTKLGYLDFSNSQISDTIPMWFWDVSSTMYSLNLSFNGIRGKFTPTLLYIQKLDLSSNYLDGPLPLILSGCVKINLSKNKFTGTISSLWNLSASDFPNLYVLDCSHNLLSGVLPDSWANFPRLVYLNIGYNNFSGIIPMSTGYLIHLQTLILRNNNFYGELPNSLRNCSKLGFADFGLNNLSGKIPEWIGEDLLQLYALILKSNKFYGSMPHHLCHLSNLHFLDLSINRMSGTVPPCFSNFTSMIQNESEIAEHYYAIKDVNASDSYPKGSYIDNALANWKGNEFEYGRSFAYLKMIDLSTNELSGEIPIGITRLFDLKGLNLSRNKFFMEKFPKR